MSVENIISLLQKNVRHGEIHIENLPAKGTVFGHLEHPLHRELTSLYLDSLGIDHLYSHQAEAINTVKEGTNVIIVSKTASGKTLCFNLPVVDHLLSDPDATALYLYPTKALAQDQFKTLTEILLHTSKEIKCGIYDGDTPQSDRSRIRKSARILLSNPDMLHFALLPYHRGWMRFLKNLSFVVIDEVHAYRGTFGSHVGLVLRRLFRICRAYGRQPQIIGASATIANAKEHAENLTGLPFELIDNDGAPKGQKKFVLWNPPVISEQNDRLPSTYACINILSVLIRSKLKTICFARSRNQVEIIYSTLKKRYPRYKMRIEAYRGGYLPEERRNIEHRLFSGQTDMVISTNALELGIDIGALDVCVIAGYPGSIGSLWQQAGRAGRTSRLSLAIYVANQNPLDQFFIQHPDMLFGASPEHAITNIKNVVLLTQHIQCALHELPLSHGDYPLFGDKTASILGVLVEAGLARTNYEKDQHNTRWTPVDPDSYPHRKLNLRTIGDTYQIIENNSGTVIGTIDKPGAYQLLYKEAIYLHRSKPYRSLGIDFDAGSIKVEYFPSDYYTEPSCEIRIPGMKDMVEQNQWRNSGIFFGDIDVFMEYQTFRKIKLMSRSVLGYGKIDLPPLTLTTESIRIVLPPDLAVKARAFGPDFLPAGLGGIIHLFLNMVSLHVMADPGDINSYLSPLCDEFYVFDTTQNGSGYSEKAFRLVEQIFSAVFEQLTNCPCQQGCPACIIQTKKSYSHAIDYNFPKEAAKFVIYFLLEKGIYQPRIPQSETYKKYTGNDVERQTEPLSLRDLKRARKGIL